MMVNRFFLNKERGVGRELLNLRVQRACLETEEGRQELKHHLAQGCLRCTQQLVLV